MTDREVTYIVRASPLNSGPDRFVTHIGGPWGLAAEEDAIRDMRYGFHTYYVRSGGSRVEVKTAKGVIRNYLTAVDGSLPNLLLSLPQPLSATKASPTVGEDDEATSAIRWAWNNRPAA